MTMNLHLKSTGFLFLFVILVSLCLFVPSAEAAETFPKPRGPVNDFAGVIDAHSKSMIERVVREVWEKTATAVVIATLTTIDDNDPADYANRLYEAWGIGKKGEDKGVLIFFALKERRVRIETGYGVEGILPDGRVGEILDVYVVPYFKKGEYSKGLLNSVVAISSVIAKDAGVTISGNRLTQKSRRAERKKSGNLFSLILAFILFSMLLGTRQGRAMLPFILLMLLAGGGGRGGRAGGFGGFSGGFGGFGGGLSGGGGAGRGF